MQKETLNINGINCNNCVAGVTKILNEVFGVEKAEVSLENKSATIEFNEELVELEEIKEAINASNKYTVES